MDELDADEILKNITKVIDGKNSMLEEHSKIFECGHSHPIEFKHKSSHTHKHGHAKDHKHKDH